jgi:hypothetical protein
MLSLKGLKQIANSFDRVTIIKIAKGALIAAGGAFVLFALDAIGKIEISDPVIASAIVWLVPTLTNAIKEYLAGEKQK